ncbi:MAG: hypothetical protein AAFO94_16455, partial [Bacteroidota bacterium]
VGQPVVGDQSQAANHISLDVNFMNTKGEEIDISRLEQGTDFVAEVSIVHKGTRSLNFDEMALTQVFPSGWEIHNSRMDAVDGTPKGNQPEYRDIRDDRVLTYFDVNRNKAKRFYVSLNAAYQGRFYLPTISCEAMYDNTINAQEPGQWVEVVAPAVN